MIASAAAPWSVVQACASAPFPNPGCSLWMTTSGFAISSDVRGLIKARLLLWLFWHVVLSVLLSELLRQSDFWMSTVCSSLGFPAYSHFEHGAACPCLCKSSAGLLHISHWTVFNMPCITGRTLKYITVCLWLALSALVAKHCF
jgi:hypothetical protein